LFPFSFNMEFMNSSLYGNSMSLILSYFSLSPIGKKSNPL
jgi:hypothetical protein